MIQRLQQPAISLVSQHDINKFIDHIKYRDYERLPRRLDHPLLQYVINAKNAQDETALMWAVVNKDPEALKLLLMGGANPNIKACGKTIIMYALDKPLLLDILLHWQVKEKEDRAEWMWDGKLNLDAVDREGKTALIHAAGGNYAYTSAVFVLVDAGADVTIRDNDGMTASMYATNPAILEKLSKHAILPAHAAHFLDALEKQLKTEKAQEAVNLSLVTMNKLLQILQAHAHEGADFEDLKETLFQFSILAIMVKQDQAAREAREIAAKKLAEPKSVRLNRSFNISLDEDEEKHILPTSFL